jgi:putative LysE/RhtB family amino acid efflux pump
MTPLLADFLKGLALGFSIAAPVGPIGLLCIRRTLDAGFVAGFSGGLGTAVADAAYAAVAAFGLTAVAVLLTSAALPLQIAGIAVLAWLGVNTLRAPAHRDTAAAPEGPGGLFVQTFFLTLTNPATILSFAAVFAGLGLAASGGDRSRAFALVIGTFLGSLGWWFVLAGAISLMRHKLTPGALRWINRVAGAVLLAFATALAWTVLKRLA